MSRLIELFDTIHSGKGFHSTIIPEVRLYRCSREVKRTPMLFDPSTLQKPCFSVIVQGTQNCWYRDQSINYDKNHYLIFSMLTPLDVEIVATKEKPLMGFTIDIDKVLLHEIITIMDSPQSTNDSIVPRTVGRSFMDANIECSFEHLLKALADDVTAKVKVPGILREIYFYALQGEQASLLQAMTRSDGDFISISKVLEKFNVTYSEKVNVEELAHQANMSVSAFHRTFKKITSESPVQYLKKIRLQRARELILNTNSRSYQAAEAVGYESVSQFSREFKRYFGNSPSDLKRALNV